MVTGMKRLYFIRHGLSEFNKAQKWAGSSDTPLAPEGKEQAKLAGKLAREQGLIFDVIVSSPLGRAHETAKHVASEMGYPHDKIVVNDIFTERNFGILEGKKGKDDLFATTKYIIDESSIDSYENVEKLAELHKRAEEALEYLNSLPHDTVLVVGHGASGRALWRVVSGKPVSIRNVRYNNAEIIRFI